MADVPDTSSGNVRLTELLGVLSLGTDLGMGHPMEHAIRQSLLAVRLGEYAGLDEQQRGVVYYASLVAWVGCHVDAYEQAKWFGDDRAFKADARGVDLGRPVEATAYVLGWPPHSTNSDRSSDQHRPRSRLSRAWDRTTRQSR